MQVNETTPCFASTVYHFPMRISSDRESEVPPRGVEKRPTFINSYSDMVRNVILSNINNIITRIHSAIRSWVINRIFVKEIKAGIRTGPRIRTLK